MGFTETRKASSGLVGARASNAGDVFHELWALRYALQLLIPKTDLKAVTVEGVAAPDGSECRYDGVDCALFFGDTTVGGASRLELLQLKYSTSDPSAPWTIARLTANSAKTGNNSVLRRLAKSFVQASQAASTADIVVRLISNQPVAGLVVETLQAMRRGEPAPEESDRFVEATGLSGEDLNAFLAALDFSQMGAGSRTSLLDSLTFAVAGIINGNAEAQVLVLQGRVRALMLPGAEQEKITQNTVLSWFGINSTLGLFPAPPSFQTTPNPIARLPTRKLLDEITKGSRLICLHGQGGCGKTTTLLQLAELLPRNSLWVAFDCYGSGRYTHSNDRRHLPENAFLQIVNELAWAQETPFIIANASTNLATIKTFLERLENAASILAAVDSNAILAVLVDAADNSVAAAELSTPTSPCFIWEVTQADLTRLPVNVRIVLSTRTPRKSKLQFPKGTPEIECPVFTRDETRAFVLSRQLNVDETWIEQFHALSSGIPRVQSYAIAKGSGVAEATLNALRPNGKKLDAVFLELFQEAAVKSGEVDLHVRCMAALGILPGPVPLRHLAAVSRSTVGTVVDFIGDVHPTLRCEDDAVTIADEDVEDFLKKESNVPAVTIQDICEYFVRQFRTDTYAATHYCDFLERASRAAEILPILERDLLPAGITDPIVRREVQLRRLRLALRACRSAGSHPDTIKVVLLSAEASKDEDAFRTLLEQETDLAVRFASSSLFRLVLSDRDRYPKQGSILAQDAARTAVNGDFVSARERLHAYGHWMNRRREVPREKWSEWEVETDDVTAIVEAIAIMDGAAAAKAAITRWRPVTLWPRVAQELVTRLVVRGRADIVEDAQRDGLLPHPWSLLLTVPLALAGHEPSVDFLADQLVALRPSNVPNLRVAIPSPEEGWEISFLETVVTGIEIGLSRGVAPTILCAALKLILNYRDSTPTRITEHDPAKIDIALRSWLIANHLGGIRSDEAKFVDWLSGPAVATKAGRGRKRKPPAQDHTDSELSHTVRAIFPVYVSRLRCLEAPRTETAGSSETTELAQIGGNSYYFDRNYSANGFRQRAGQSIVRLMHVKGLSTAGLLGHAQSIAQANHDDSFAHQLLPIWQELLLRPSMHQSILDGVTARSTALQALRVGSKSKADALTRFSRLLANFSDADARAMFERATEIVLEIDREAMVQIGFVASLVPRHGMYGEGVARSLAVRHAAFVTDVAIRLEGEEGFPWVEATEALTNFAPEVALMATSQWQDEDVARLNQTLPSLASRMALVSCQSFLGSCSLLNLLGHLSKSLLETLTSVAREQDRRTAYSVFETLARHCLLHVPPSSRSDLGEVILSNYPLDLASGPHILRLRETVAFSVVPEEASDTRSPKAEPSIQFHEDADFTTQVGIAAAIKDEMDRKREGYISLGSVLQSARQHITTPAQRVPFLEAVSQFDGDSLYATHRTEALLAALRQWKGGPAVESWRTLSLPDVITRNLWALSRWLHEQARGLSDLLGATGLDSRACFNIIASGLEQEDASFSSATLFELAKLMAPGLLIDECRQVAEWYVARLYQHVPADIRSRYVAHDVPGSIAEALGRFLFSQMSDVDVRIRWRAAHCVRRLVTLSGGMPLLALYGQYDRKEDPSFRLSGAPFYWLSARLWLVMTSARIAVEDPKAASAMAPKLLEIALDERLPHYLIRSHAKEALGTLLKATSIHLNESELRRLSDVNRAKQIAVKQKRGTYRELEGYELKGNRFRFDYIDTVRYWYAAVYRLFAKLTPEKFFGTLEKWLLDEWKVDSEANWWDKEPRRSRYSDREHMLYSHSHGSSPTIERYGTYLEWHAMFCALGELLESEPLAEPEWESDSLDYYMRRWNPTELSSWLADRRGCTPLEEDFVRDEGGQDKHWLRRVPRQKFISAVIHRADPMELTIYGRWTVSHIKRQTEISVSSALVEPETAASLIRAMQPAEEYKFFLPIETEGDEHDIESGPFVLRSWLGYGNSESQFDEMDPLRNDVKGLSVRPATWLSKRYRLAEKGVPTSAWTSSKDEPWFAYHAWADFGTSEADPRYALRQRGANGFRLKGAKGALRKVLLREKRDLIVKVQFERRLENEYGTRSESEKRYASRRYLILRQDGSIEDQSGCVGAWF